MKPKITLLVGPPGVGKSTLSKQYVAEGRIRVSGDDQGKQGQYEVFHSAANQKLDLVIDRMNFDRDQRRRFLDYVKQYDYETEIIVLHQPYDVCLARASTRTDHPTVKDAETAYKAVNFFFTKYQRPELDEADKVSFVYPDGHKPEVIVCDLDGTLCNVEHRRHHVRGEGRKNWKAFFDGIPDDTVNKWCADLLERFSLNYQIVYCSGRGDDRQRETMAWLIKHDLDKFVHPYDGETTPAALYMRKRNDSRQDSIVKEIILDFEILTRYTPYFMIDDRQQVVDMWRKRGFVCLQCDEGNF